MRLTIALPTRSHTDERDSTVDTAFRPRFYRLKATVAAVSLALGIVATAGQAYAWDDAVPADQPFAADTSTTDDSSDYVPMGYTNRFQPYRPDCRAGNYPWDTPAVRRAVESTCRVGNGPTTRGAYCAMGYPYVGRDLRCYRYSGGYYIAYPH